MITIIIHKSENVTSKEIASGAQAPLKSDIKAIAPIKGTINFTDINRVHKNPSGV